MYWEKAEERLQLQALFAPTYAFYIYCSRTFLIYLFIRIAGVSYGRFIAVRFGFNLLTYSQNRLWEVGWVLRERDLNKKRLAADNGR